MQEKHLQHLKAPENANWILKFQNTRKVPRNQGYPDDNLFPHPSSAAPPPLLAYTFTPATHPSLPSPSWLILTPTPPTPLVEIDEPRSSNRDLVEKTEIPGQNQRGARHSTKSRKTSVLRHQLFEANPTQKRFHRSVRLIKKTMDTELYGTNFSRWIQRKRVFIGV